MSHHAHPGGSSRRSQDPPLVEGGQGRIPQEVVDDAVASMHVIVYIVVLLGVAGAAALVWGVSG